MSNPPNPLNTYNEVVRRASQGCRGVKSMILVSSMLDQLKVIGVTENNLILIPSRPFLRAAMLKRQSKILAAIKAIAPEVESIHIIPDVNSLTEPDK